MIKKSCFSYLMAPAWLRKADCFSVSTLLSFSSSFFYFSMIFKNASRSAFAYSASLISFSKNYFLRAWSSSTAWIWALRILSFSAYLAYLSPSS